MFLISTLFLNLIPNIVKLFKKTISIFKVRDFGLGNMGFSMGVLVYGVEVGFFLCGGVWFLLVVLSCGSYYGYFGEVRVEV